MILSHCNDIRDMARAAPINSAFRKAMQAEPLWKCLCEKRWRTRWGFEMRFARAEAKARDGARWNAMYRAEEQDALRQTIRAEELVELVWDFRFWIGPPHINMTIPDKPGYTMRASGLRVKIAEAVRMCEVADDEPKDELDDWQPDGTVSKGHVQGHPNGNVPTMRWYLVDGGAAVIWGYAPHLWPKGRIVRTPLWGWELQNPNVCMRAIDTSARPPAPLWADAIDNLRAVQLGEADPDGEPILMEMSPVWVRHWGRRWLGVQQ